MMRRLLLFALSASLAALGGWDAALAYWRVQSPGSVPDLLADDLELAVRRADHDLAYAERLAVSTGKMHGNAVAALRAAPLNAMAMRQLGMAMALSEAADGQKQFVLAERISRRDLPDQLLLIEANAHAGDVASTLAHYDRALSVHSEIGDKLYVVLAGAVTDDEIGTALAHYADRRWFPGLIGTAIEADVGSAVVTRMLGAARPYWPTSDLEALHTRQLKRLVERGQYLEARGFARQMPGVSTDALEEIGFSAASTDTRLIPLSWRLANENGAEAKVDAGGALAVRLASEQSAIVAERVTLLAPRTYEFIQTLGYEEGSPRARLTWNVQCLGSVATPIWRQLVPSHEGQVTYRSSFTVPLGCIAQLWRLMATADVAPMDSVAYLDGLALIK